ncbi:sigma-70 family RNA polymerase sigma factor [Cryobacterium ruanii]|uniref:Sigma-70 family RNA polymerase sigma factor n=1 Tax=Cryobacterium ruanii TaxID=1259197 RepID=A0A4R9AQA4_9MICO|nr:sigma-70 family RNA polymerase sigma factor [Cryobacterium ruanii]TFD67978.1 sigma-70 family RNA polymerase sigma factor [Cryobacterium ruanii]
MTGNQHNPVPRVTREQEAAWHAAATLGRASALSLEAIEHHALRTLTARTLLREAAAGRAAEAAFTAAYDGLCINAAARVRGRGVDLEDLIQEARLALVRATRRFKLELGFAFATYAVPFVAGALSNHIQAAGRVIRLPKDVHSELARLRRVTETLTTQWGREPTRRELALTLGCEPERITELENWVAPTGVITEAMEETVSDPTAADVDTALTDAAAVLAMLEPVTGRAREVLELRFGLAGGWPMTQEEVGAVLGISHQSVSAAEARGYAAIKAPSCASTAF